MDLITPKEAMQMLPIPVPQSTFYSWLNQNRVPCRRLGGRYYIPRAEFGAFLAGAVLA